MAVIIQFPIHARVLSERPEREQSTVVVLPFARVRRAKASATGLSPADHQHASCAVTATVTSDRRD